MNRKKQTTLEDGAEEIGLPQTFHLGEKAGKAFTRALENPPRPVRALIALGNKRGPWRGSAS